MEITQDTSTYPTIAAFGTAVNDVAFAVTLPESLPCGAVVTLSLALSRPGIDETVPVTIATGYDGASTPDYARGRPTDIPNGTASLNRLASIGGTGSGTSSISVRPATNVATVSGIEVHLGHLDYPLDHLRISLRGPNLEQIVLLDHPAGAAQSLDDTVFAADGDDQAVTTATCPTHGCARRTASMRCSATPARAPGSSSSRWTTRPSSASWTTGTSPSPSPIARPRAFASLVATPTQVAPNGDVLLDASGTVVDGPATYAYSTPGGFASITGGATAQAHVDLHHARPASRDRDRP